MCMLPGYLAHAFQSTTPGLASPWPGRQTIAAKHQYIYIYIYIYIYTYIYIYIYTCIIHMYIYIPISLSPLSSCTQPGHYVGSPLRRRHRVIINK